MCFLWCCTVTLTWRPNFQSPKWVNQISNDNLTDIPKSVIQLQERILYPTRLFFQNMFSSQYQIDKSRMLQVWIKVNFIRNTRKPSMVYLGLTRYLFLFSREHKYDSWSHPIFFVIPMELDLKRDQRLYIN